MPDSGALDKAVQRQRKRKGNKVEPTCNPIFPPAGPKNRQSAQYQANPLPQTSGTPASQRVEKAKLLPTKYMVSTRDQTPPQRDVSVRLNPPCSMEPPRPKPPPQPVRAAREETPSQKGSPSRGRAPGRAVLPCSERTPPPRAVPEKSTPNPQPPPPGRLEAAKDWRTPNPWDVLGKLRGGERLGKTPLSPPPQASGEKQNRALPSPKLPKGDTPPPPKPKVGAKSENLNPTPPGMGLAGSSAAPHRAVGHAGALRGWDPGPHGGAGAALSQQGWPMPHPLPCPIELPVNTPQFPPPPQPKVGAKSENSKVITPPCVLKPTPPGMGLAGGSATLNRVDGHAGALRGCDPGPHGGAGAALSQQGWPMPLPVPCPAEPPVCTPQVPGPPQTLAQEGHPLTGLRKSGQTP